LTGYDRPDADHDAGFHEIHLSGKQLVFLCMATTLVAVVIFLCGVLVGRGVSAAQPASDAGIAADAGPAAADPAQAAGGVPTTEPTPPPEVSYPSRLDSETPPAESIKPAESNPAEPASAPPAPAEPAAPQPAAERPAGFVVQVAALRTRGQADALVRQLADKGYPAFVLEPTGDSPVTFYRVRIGPYPDRRDAEAVARRLETEEQFKSIITR
jgi:cell division septation protein DedD